MQLYDNVYIRETITEKKFGKGCFQRLGKDW